MESYEDQEVYKSNSNEFPESQVMFKEGQDQRINKNIEDLKKIQKSKKLKEFFDEIYNIINRIIMESDFYAMTFVVKEKFYDVSSRFDQSIFERSIDVRNFKLARHIIEFGGNCNYNYYFPTDSDLIRFISKIHRFDINNALIKAAYLGHFEIVKHLLTVPGIDVNAKTRCKNTALMNASYSGYYEVVKVLLSFPEIDINAKDWDNNTALMQASLNGHHKVVKLLLTVPGIDVNAKNMWKETALILASKCGRHEVVKLLLTVPGIDKYQR